ncbi:MAG: enoyl-CoA hydratase/isomerase family protein [Alphaproteobacteria bacterium]|nr:enoyl-CoA hydratase/isomerase family protein [Alphaproteobacteria bacterium]MBU1551314.1 enoyl-CoA hydratase/isomerase family protein [Alphaproteobacteria bacterium]MBU2334751.1 enoyl-CoA hydratase/isomerase family protein [Alphaproteobacteria bacterium]MBU2389254.1 enoyl-CoA hydratase/isomerase family protein [Alphaproteobacteria bacterium]
MTGTVHLERDGDVAFLVIDNPPVNAGSSDVRTALLAQIAAVETDASITGIVLIGAGKTFIAGSDLREFDLPLDPPQLPQVIAAIEASRKPYVAALHGAALGGGYELALACDARIAAPATVVGLPECTLGIIPGAGGTQKLPRLVGKAKAIGLICSGGRVSSTEALRLGMIDAVSGPDLRTDAAALVRQLAGQKHRLIDRPVPDDASQAIEAAALKAAAAGRNRPHVLAAIRHIRSVATVEAHTGLAAERAEFEALRVSPEAKALRHIFFAEREAARGTVPAGVKGRPFKSFGIVGAGTMGADIATTTVQAGYRTVLVDSSLEALERAKARISQAIDKGVAAGKLSKPAGDTARDNLVTAVDLQALAGCDVLIEAVFEDIDTKRAVFARLDEIAGADALLATNTSYLDIDAIAAGTTRPRDVIGLHFFSPAHIMKLLEVVAGKESSHEALATGLAVAKALGKQPVQASNGFGFIGNRIYAAYRASCEFMLEDGALPHEVDDAMRQFGFAMGPFAVADMSGLDIAWRMRQQQAAARDPAWRYVEIPDRLCEMGRLGRKTGAGYYDYDEDGRAERSPRVEQLIIEASDAKGIARRRLTAQDIQNRAMAAIVNEAGLVLEDKVAARASDIDVVLVNGYGFPRWHGGPLYWASRQDRQRLAADCAAAAAEAGPSKRRADLAGLFADRDVEASR